MGTWLLCSYQYGHAIMIGFPFCARVPLSRLYMSSQWQSNMIQFSNNFRDRDRYVQGDYRFRHGYCKHNPRKMVKTWAEKEMRNLIRYFFCLLIHGVKKIVLDSEHAVQVWICLNTCSNYAKCPSKLLSSLAVWIIIRTFLPLNVVSKNLLLYLLSH